MPTILHHSPSRILTRLGEAALALKDWIARQWYARPFRWQILIAITLLTFLTGSIGAVLAVIDARNRAAVETKSNVELWRHHIAAQSQELYGPADIEPFTRRLEQEMAQVRHVVIRVVTPDGLSVGHTAGEQQKQLDSGEHAPDWFVSLVQPTKYVESVPITTASGQRLATVLIEGKPDDEIAEAWELLVLMSILWLGGTALMMTGLYFVLGYILGPLVTLSEGMHELEGGHYGLRLEAPKVREFGAIVGSFNTLAEALDNAHADNSRLYRQLIAVQEDERKQISRDLHDEFGPCLFGIAAGTGSIERHARTVPEPQSSAILSCVNEIALASDRLKSLNRALLNRLRPVSLGRVTLTELIAELVVTFERRHTDKRFQRNSEGLLATYGEDIDLTIYRCVQEGLTNAVRHGRPSLVSVSLSATTTASGACVRLRIADDGVGISDTASIGYGLSGMRERVRALSGTLAIEPMEPAGTALVVTIPVRLSEAAPSATTHPLGRR